MPSLRIAFLSSFGSCIHASAVRVLFRTLTIEDDARIFSCTKGPTPNAGAMYPLLTSPARYAPVVRGLIICDPDVAQAFATPSNPEIPEDLQSFRPIDTNMLALVFETCENIEELVWESSLSLPDGLCEVCLFVEVLLLCGPSDSGCAFALIDLGIAHPAVDTFFLHAPAASVIGDPPECSNEMGRTVASTSIASFDNISTSFSSFSGWCTGLFFTSGCSSGRILFFSGRSEYRFCVARRSAVRKDCPVGTKDPQTKSWNQWDKVE